MPPRVTSESMYCLPVSVERIPNSRLAVVAIAIADPICCFCSIVVQQLLFIGFFSNASVEATAKVWCWSAPFPRFPSELLDLVL